MQLYFLGWVSCLYRGRPFSSLHREGTASAAWLRASRALATTLTVPSPPAPNLPPPPSSHLATPLTPTPLPPPHPTTHPLFLAKTLSSTCVEFNPPATDRQAAPHRRRSAGRRRVQRRRRRRPGYVQLWALVEGVPVNRALFPVVCQERGSLKEKDAAWCHHTSWGQMVQLCDAFLSCNPWRKYGTVSAVLSAKKRAMKRGGRAIAAGMTMTGGMATATARSAS